LTWLVAEEGLFFAMIDKNLKIHEIKRLEKCIDIDLPERLGLVSSFRLVKQIKIVKHSNGNIFVLWIRNGNWKHEIHIKPFIKGQWEKTLKIFQGEGLVRLPDVTMDSSGILHLAYIKIEQNKKTSCNYRKIF